MRIATYRTYDELFDALTEINNNGVEPNVAGVDDRGTAFLAVLGGIYADTVSVVIGDPWDSEAWYDGECGECSGGRGAVRGATTLAYPIAVLRPTPPEAGFDPGYTGRHRG